MGYGGNDFSRWTKLVRVGDGELSVKDRTVASVIPHTLAGDICPFGANAPVVEFG